MAMLAHENTADPERIARKSNIDRILLLPWLGAWVDFIVLSLFFLRVTAGDLDRYKSAVAGHVNVKIKEFPTLNHLFIGGEGTPDEYKRPVG